MDAVELANVIQSDPERARRELDPLYFIEKHLWILGIDGTRIPFKLNEVQLAIYQTITDCWQNKKPVRIVLLKPRRFGVSTLTLALALHTSIYAPGAESIIESHDLKSANYLFSILQGMFYYLDVPEKPKTQQNADGILSFRYPHGAKITVETGRKKESGRAFQLKVFHGSEVAFWENPDSVMLGVESALSDVDLNSISLLESTANGVGNWFYKRYQAAKKNKAGDYKALFFPWFALPDRRRDPGPLTEDDLGHRERQIYDQHGLDLAQMAWYRWVLEQKCNGDEDLRAQEYPTDDEEAFLASGKCRFRPVVLGSLPVSDGYSEGVIVHTVNTEGKIKDIKFVRTDEGPIRVWERPQPSTPYVIGVDVADGIGQNASAAVVLNAATGMQAAELYGQFEPDNEMGELVFLLGQWYNIALLGVEVPGPGISTISRLSQMNYPTSRMIHHFTSANYKGTNRLLKLGWRATEISKTLAVNALVSGLTSGEIGVRSARLKEQMKTYVRKDSGKYEAQSGEFDDLVSALYIATACLLDPRSKVVLEAAVKEPRGGLDDRSEPPARLRRSRRRAVWSSYGTGGL